MPASFQIFKPLIITLEGEKLTRIKGDAGGLTKYGITEATYPHIDIANLTFDGACDIWEKDYWNHYSLSRIDSQAIANKVMSYLMNMNPFSAVRCVQKAVNHCGGNIPEDGLLGANTFNSISQLPHDWLLDRMRIEGVTFYVYRVSVKPDQIEFLEGWCNRALL